MLRKAEGEGVHVRPGSRILWILLFSALAASAVLAQGSRVSGTVSGDTASPADERGMVLGEGSANREPGESGGSGIVSALRATLVLALLAGGVWIAVVLVRKASPRPDRQDSDSAIRIAASATLGPGKAIHAVCLGSKAWLVGSSENSITLIDRIEDPALIQELVARAETAGNQVALRRSPAARFGDFLAASLSGRGISVTKPGRSGVGEMGGFLASQRERLRKYRDGGKG